MACAIAQTRGDATGGGATATATTTATTATTAATATTATATATGVSTAAAAQTPNGGGRFGLAGGGSAHLLSRQLCHHCGQLRGGRRGGVGQ